MSRRYRLLIVAPQPVHNEACSLRLIAASGDFDLTVAYLSMPDQKLWRGEEYLTKPVFDTALSGDYPWISVPNRSPFPGLGRFWGVMNPGLLRLIRQGAFDCCIVYGYAYVSCWLAAYAARRARIPLVLTTDATTLAATRGPSWKTALKRLVLPAIYRGADLVLAPSSATVRFLQGLGVPADRVARTPYVVDNDALAAQARDTDRDAVRRSWGVPPGAVVALFCGKFIERKRPLDLVRAFARAAIDHAYLVMIGEGPLRDAITREARQLRVDQRVVLPGLVPYAQLAAAYAASDLLVHPASHEPWGLPVNEAMACGVPVVCSEQVGAAGDLIEEGRTGYVVPAGDVDALRDRLRDLLARPGELPRLGAAARERMRSWSPRDNAEAVMSAVRRLVDRHQGGAAPCA